MLRRLLLLRPLLQADEHANENNEDSELRYFRLRVRQLEEEDEEEEGDVT